MSHLSTALSTNYAMLLELLQGANVRTKQQAAVEVYQAAVLDI